MNGIIYESTDSWWVRNGDKVMCVVAFFAIFAAVAWGLMFP